MDRPNQDKNRTLEEKETNEYLGILEADTIKQGEMKEKIKKEYLKRTRKLLETKVCSRNLIKGINIYLVRYSGPVLEWTREELKQMDQRTSKLMTMPKAIHPRDNVYRLYVSRNKGIRRLAGIDRSIQRLEDYFEKRHQKRYWQHKDQQNDNNKKTKMGRKTTQ